jgi:hypothetical protein
MRLLMIAGCLGYWTTYATARQTEELAFAEWQHSAMLT